MQNLEYNGKHIHACCVSLWNWCGIPSVIQTLIVIFSCDMMRVVRLIVKSMRNKLRDSIHFVVVQLLNWLSWVKDDFLFLFFFFLNSLFPYLLRIFLPSCLSSPLGWEDCVGLMWSDFARIQDAGFLML